MHRDGFLDFGLPEEPAVASVPVAPTDIKGRKVPFNESEQHRHECEVRFAASMDADSRVAYCLGVERHRGRMAADRIRRDGKALIRALLKNATAEQ